MPIRMLKPVERVEPVERVVEGRHGLEGCFPSLEEFAGPNKDEDWWHSDDSASGDDTAKATGVSKMDEDMLYDPDMDEKDAKWADKVRQGRVSDAILSCPGCFTTLTVECQQHAHHHNQYRAMLVMNCSVNFQKPLQPAEGSRQQQGGSTKRQRRSRGEAPEMSRSAQGEQQQQQQGGQQQQQQGGQQQQQEGRQQQEAGRQDQQQQPGEGQQQQQHGRSDSAKCEQFYPVSCAVCGTEVGVQDNDEVYHFFHVFPSNA